MDNFHHNDEAVRQFFFDLKYPDGYICVTIHSLNKIFIGFSTM
ncbi:hypothetical protein Aargi30884_08530 [Amedibacterium intestinale]|uniref:Uncharacterized protein n=1 Tax=Amedibacterium intestinale TaxID=2583452 RepID=A0A6N4TG40_9FIRM|nr:hypothetical protein Aargi30884_08530 [Amedibacterium intestinale]